MVRWMVILSCLRRLERGGVGVEEVVLLIGDACVWHGRGEGRRKGGGVWGGKSRDDSWAR